MTSTLKCLVVDDSALSRKIVRAAVESLAGVEVVGTAFDGANALERVAESPVDLVTMDLEMPRMNGIEAVKRLRSISPRTKVIMVSGATTRGADVTNAALCAGAFDFVVKPVAQDVQQGVRLLAAQLKEKVDAVRCQLALPGNGVPRPQSVRMTPPQPRFPRQLNVRAIGIGVSTGGPAALGKLIPRLTPRLGAPVLVVQHMPAVFTKSLADHLNRESVLHVCEASDEMWAEPGRVYIAPGGLQMGVVEKAGRLAIRISDAPPEANAKPSVDFLFRSLVTTLGASVAAAVLTGMGDDGLAGCRAIKQAGGSVFTQDAESCVVYGMPRRVFEAGLSDAVFDLESMAAEFEKLACQRSLLCT